MILKLTEPKTNREIFFNTEKFVACRLIADAMPRTYIHYNGGGFECIETPEDLMCLMKCTIIADIPVWAKDEELQPYIDWARNSRDKIRLALLQQVRE